MRRRLALMLIAPLSLLAAGHAVACSWTQRPEAVGDGSAQFFGRRMAAAAATVDLVLVEDDGARPMDEPSTGVLVLRSLAHLKGDGPDRFSLFGNSLTFSAEAERTFAAPLQHFTNEDGQVSPFPYNEERQGSLFPNAASPPFPAAPDSSCSPPGLAAQNGRFYVVMRGADGRLLRNVPLHGDPRSPAFAFVPVTLDPEDAWLRAVLMGAGRAPATEGAPMLHLRGDVNPATVEAALRRAGVTAVAAFVRSGDWTDEIRPSDAEARAPWLARAVPMVAQRNRSPFGSGDHGAAEFLRRKVRFEHAFGGLGYEVAQAFTASVRRRQLAKAAPPRLVAVALSGPADAVAAVSREPFADGLRPLPARTRGLPQLPGQTEAERFAAMQAIERDIWLLNGGAGNPQGTLPANAP